MSEVRGDKGKNKVGGVRRRLSATPQDRSVGAVAVAAGAIVALISLVVFAFPGIGPWAWLVVMAPAASPMLDQVRAFSSRRRHRPPDLATADLRGADLRGADLTSRYLRNRDLSSARLIGATLADADLTGAILVDTRFHRADLSGANLQGARCDTASFYRSEMVDAKLDRIRAHDTSFEEADLRGASLAGADLRRARLDGADLRRADLTGATIGTRALARAFTDSTTTLPDGTSGHHTAGRDTAGSGTAGRGTAGREMVGVGASGTAAPRRPKRREPRWFSGELVRPALIGLGVASAMTGVVAGPGLRVGSTGSEISADLARGEQALPEWRAGGIDKNRAAASVDQPRASASDRSSTTGAARDSTGREVGAVAEVRDSDDAEEAPGSLLDAGVPAPSPTPALAEDGPGSAASSGMAPPATDEAEVESGSDAESATAEVELDVPSGLDDRLVEADVPTPDRAAQSTPSVPLEAGVPPVVGGQGVARTIEVLVTSDGASSTATIRSAIGDGQLLVDEAEQFVLEAAPGGAVIVDVLPIDENTAASCAILVDGVQRSFRQGFTGEPITCQIDLGRTPTP